MPLPRTKRRLVRLTSAWGLVGLGLALASCGNETGKRVENLPPSVLITGGAVGGDSISYNATIFWTGWDEDGIIDHYQYAIDIPEDLIARIDDPLDTQIDWTDTTAFRARFLFQTPYQDTIIKGDGTIDLPRRFRGDHEFFVRAVDNEGATSTAAFVHFTARNVTPQTRFTVPRVIAQGDQPLLQVGSQLNVAWEGVDPDNPDPRRRPKYYEWKLIEHTRLLGLPDTELDYAVNVSPGPRFEWNRVGADTTSLRLSLDPPKDYLLAIRAIDEAGGIENRFVGGRNVVKLSSSNRNPGTPILTVRERTLGSFVFPDAGAVVEFDVPLGRCLRFDFMGDASDYGGIVQGYNYGVDVTDVDQEGPTSGFRGWSLIPFTFDPICFDSPGVHVVTLKCRDTGGGVTIGQVLLRVVAFPLDREVLYLDDHRLTSSGGITDEMMDARAIEVLRSVGFSEIFTYDAFGNRDLLAIPVPPKLGELGRYRFIYWSCWGAGFAAINALVNSNACQTNRTLQAYLATGGSVWIFGQQVFSAFKRFTGTQECKGSLGYDESIGLNFLGPPVNDFPCDFMRICPGDFRNAKNRPQDNGMTRALPTAEAQLEMFPPLEIDSTAFVQVRDLKGIPFVDAMFQPTFDADGGLDTLYTLDTPRSTSSFRGKPTAFRFADPNPVPEQGPIAIFGFPFHLLKQGSAEERTGVKGMARSMMEWLRSHQAVAQAHLAP